MTHSVTWDHSDCEHADDPDEHDCTPRGSITCNDPTGSCRKHCQTTEYGSCKDGWNYCENDCLGYDHVDPGVEHCTNGHPLVLGECNAVLFIEEDVEGCGPRVPTYFDGPIEVEWVGDGYTWTYVDTVPHDAVG